MGTTGALQGKI